jgi:cation diffusion facilitator family transporter
MGFRKAQSKGRSRARSVKRVLWFVLGLNVAVALAKLSYGLLSGSIAMEADGFHSLFDGASNVVGLVGIVAAEQPADRDHPYGHGKYEAYASAIIGATLLAAAWKVGGDALDRFVRDGAPPRVDVFSFLVMAGTLAVNLAVTMYERHKGRALRSEILLADASHTASDVFVSLGVIGGLVAVRAGFPLADPIIALGVAGFIVWTAWQVFRRVNETLSDQTRIPVTDVCGAALTVPGVLGCHSIRTRGASSQVCVDLHIQVDPTVTVAAGHRTAEAVERAVCQAFDEVVDVIVHLEPMDRYQAGKTAGENGSPAP